MESENKKFKIFSRSFLRDRFLGLIDEILAVVIIGAAISLRRFILSNIWIIALTAFSIIIIFYLIKTYRNEYWFELIAIFFISSAVILGILIGVKFFLAFSLSIWKLIIISSSITIFIELSYLIIKKYKLLPAGSDRKKIEKRNDWLYSIIGSFLVGFILLLIEHKSGLFEGINKSSVPPENKNKIIEQIENDMVKISGGVFMYRGKYVRLDDYYMGKFEVTTGQYKEFIKEYENDSGILPQWQVSKIQDNYYSGLCESDQPIIGISWGQALRFCKWLSEKTGESYTLPTELQWEYSAQAGGTGFFGLGKDGKEITEANFYYYAWYRDNSNSSTAFVGLKLPNAFGLYDIWGNGEEWCLDSVSDDSRIAKGGSWNDALNYCYTKERTLYNPDYISNTVTFRIVKNIN